MASSLTSSMVKAGARGQGGMEMVKATAKKPLICDSLVWVVRCRKKGTLVSKFWSWYASASVEISREAFSSGTLSL